MMEGRNASDIAPEEYFEMLIGAKDATKLTMVDFGKKIVLMDIMNASNTAVLGDYAIGAREIVDIADVLDTDGPMKARLLIVSVMVLNKSKQLVTYGDKLVVRCRLLKEQLVALSNSA